MPSKKQKNLFVIHYRDPESGDMVSLKARKVEDSSLGLTFVSISDFVFGTDQVLVNPKEEDLKRRFEDVQCLHLSIHTIVSIEEVGEDHKGLELKKDRLNLVVMPGESAAPPSKPKPESGPYKEK